MKEGRPKKKKKRERRVYAIWFYLCKLQEIQTNIEWKKADSGFLGDAVLWGERQIANGHQETLGGSEYVHYLDFDVKIFHICENLSSLNICSLLYINCTSTKLFFKRDGGPRKKKNQTRRIDILTEVSPFMWDFHPNSLPAHDFIYTSRFTVFKHGLAPFLLTLFYGTRFIFNCK